MYRDQFRQWTCGRDKTVCKPQSLIMLTALASRAGDELLTATAARGDRTVQWKDPKAFGFPAFTTGVHVDPSKAANSRQIHSILDKGGKQIGLLTTLAPHGLRRGAARDQAHVEPTGNGYTSTLGEVQNLPSHSHDAFQRGVTKSYVGPSDRDDWAPRLKNAYFDPLVMPAKAPDASAYVAPRWSKADIDRLCAEYKLPSDSKSSRMKAGRLGLKALHEAWIEAQKAGRHSSF
ncbi:unnamed protein product [Periconia digitata]|uniref:Uncharacterized protein n=1 Tax=Periconia digitata TaxID=1303443 RepID=A0A9W4XNJ4_9PLEO|nr:unnamed protein product [Periconia digitata]